ncbi:hypothetical protein QQF64_004171 [Cirrhinus molitorella]|uniref:Uncharacterized protein n=1 Tax=Cirrhinus molitorella TaxID=172907 RepID=A0ABR3MHJ9_9TELE
MADTWKSSRRLRNPGARQMMQRSQEDKILTSANAAFMRCCNCTAGSASSDYPVPFCSFLYKHPLVAAEPMMQHTNRPHQQRIAAVGFSTGVSRRSVSVAHPLRLCSLWSGIFENQSSRIV